MGSGNWIVDNLNSALATWNEKLTEIWTLISTSPEEFKGGGIWDVILNIHDALRAIGYALLVLFFVAGFTAIFTVTDPPLPLTQTSRTHSLSASSMSASRPPCRMSDS